MNLNVKTLGKKWRSCNLGICDALQEKVTYVGKINFEFSSKLDSGHPYQHVPGEYKACCSIEPEKRAYKVRILKNVLSRKLSLNFLEDIKMRKNSCLNTAYTNLAEIWLWDIWSIYCINPLVTISLSDRPGHFFSIRLLIRSTGDHTMVSQTVFFFHFFSNTFSNLNISGHTTVSQTGFKKTWSVRLWYGHWRPGIKCL